MAVVAAGFAACCLDEKTESGVGLESLESSG